MLVLFALPIAMASAPAEQTAFVCRIGNRTATVVRSGSSLAYRSEVRGGLEMQVTGGYISRTGYSGGGELEAVFRSGPWSYVVYERTIRTGFHGHNDPRFSAGVDVLRRGRTVARRRCVDGDAQFDSGALAGLPEGSFVEH